MAFIAVAVGWLGLGIGCDNGGGGSSKPDVGLNDINTVVCIGDSITDGGCAPAGAPYPSRLAGLSGKTVINAGVCGSTSDSGAARVRGLLERHKPGYLCILYGINDLTFGRGVDNVIENVRFMADSAKANKTIPLIATLLPVYDSHRFIASQVKEANRRLRSLASALNVPLVDLELEFGIDRSLIQEDGLHPSDSGNQLIALSFNDEI